MVMDLQTIINIGLGLIGFLGGWIINSITRSVDRLDADVRSMQKDYVTKDDYHRDIGEIKSICKQIFDKLDAKADK
jgi:hypothetical protein